MLEALSYYRLQRYRSAPQTSAARKGARIPPSIAEALPVSCKAFSSALHVSCFRMQPSQYKATYWFIAGVKLHVRRGAVGGEILNHACIYYY